MWDMSSISQERFDEYFGWFSSLEPYIEHWKQMIAIGETIKGFVHTHGYSHKIYDELEKILGEEYPDASTICGFLDP